MALSPRLRALLAAQTPNIACPVPGCCDRPINNCEYCVPHQRLVNQWSLWLDGIRGMTDCRRAFDDDRATWERTGRIERDPATIPPRQAPHPDQDPGTH